MNVLTSMRSVHLLLNHQVIRPDSFRPCQNGEFPWLVGRFRPARHSGAAKICFILGQIALYFTVTEIAGDNAIRSMALHNKARCRPVGPSHILLGEVLTAP